jgi:osomolarity two-component system phosphorelay intermediate protein YPD1
MSGVLTTPPLIYRINRDLAQLSKLGHFLKGSAAALGVWKLQYSCEKIQQHGELVDEEKELTEEEALATIGTLLKQAKEEYKDADTELRRWYDDNQSLRSATP